MKISKIKTKEDAQRILNDTKLYNDLLKQNRTFFYKLAQSKIKNYPFDKGEMIQDLVQEGMISFHKALLKFNPSDENPTTLSTYAYTVIKNDLIKFLQRETNRTCYRIIDEDGNENIKGTMSLEDGLFKKSRSNGSGDASYEPKEDLFFKTNPSKYRTVEDQVIPMVYEEQVLSQLSDLDRKILTLRADGKSGRQIANAINMNYHSYKRYLYVVLEKQLQKIKEEENL